jgi:hypothetical protein
MRPGYYEPTELFECFAPVVRGCFVSHKNTTGNILKDSGLDDVSTLFRNTSEFSAFFTSGTLPSDKRPDGFHRFFYVSRRPDEPLELHPYTLTMRLLSNYRISNPHFISLIVNEFARQELHEQQDFLRIVSPYPTISGPVFESFAINWLEDVTYQTSQQRPSKTMSFTFHTSGTFQLSTL